MILCASFHGVKEDSLEKRNSPSKMQLRLGVSMHLEHAFLFATDTDRSCTITACTGNFDFSEGSLNI